MITVRSPGGQFYVYNDATWVQTYPSQNYSDLFTKKDGTWIARVPNDWMLEIRSPCTMGAAPTGRRQALELLLNNDGAELRLCPGHLVEDLKRLLAKFHMQRRTWKP